MTSAPRSPRSPRRRLPIVGVAAAIGFTAFVGFPEPPPDPVVHRSTVEIADGSLVASATLTTAVTGGPEVIGLTWPGSAPATVEIRAHDSQGWSNWYVLEGQPAEAPDASSPEWQPTVSAGPAFLGRDITEVELRLVAGSPTGVVLHAIDSEPVQAGDGVATAAQPPPFVAPRSSWGADESWRDDAAGCDGNPRYSDNIRIGVVHHTVSRNDYTPAEVPAILRAIYDFHVHGNQWCDTGYNFFVDRFGQIWEGRAGGINRAVIGGHASGINANSTGVAAIGDFSTAAAPAALMNGLRAILAWKLAYHGIDPLGSSTLTIAANSSSRWPEGTVVTLPNIEGHRDSNTTGCPGQFLYSRLAQLRFDVANTVRTFPPDTRLICDWSGDGTDDLAYFQNGAWYLPDNATDWPFAADLVFGGPGDVPVCGDWNGDGRDTPGVFRRGAWHLRNSLTSGVADVTFGYGDPADVPIVGDWTGSGTDRPGVYRRGGWYLRTSPIAPGGMTADIAFGYGDPGDRPLIGDWDGDGDDTPGIYRSDAWYLRNANTTGIAQLAFGYGIPSDRPVAGDFDGGGGPDGVGVVRGSVWYLRTTPTPGAADVVRTF